MSCISRAIGSVLIAAAVSILPAFAGDNARAAEESLDTLFVRILINPTDVDLNLRYAKLAEEQGEIRKALATYERILLQDPDNSEAKAGYYRIRRELEPDSTVWSFTLGGRYETNPRQLPKSRSRPDDFTAIAKIRVEDERKTRIGRWRTEAGALGDLHADISDLNFLYVDAVTGPVFHLGNTLQVHTAVGGAYALLDGRDFFYEAAFKLGIKGILDGALDKLDIRVAYKEIDKRFSDAEGLVVDIVGRVTRNNVIASEDVFVLYPRLRYSEANGASGGVGTVPPRLFPGEYYQGGAYAAYYFPVIQDVLFGVNFNGYYREYDQPILGGGKDRNDVFISPGAQIIFKGILGNNSSIKLEYRFEKNFSNDNSEDYENHVIGVRTTRRF